MRADAIAQVPDTHSARTIAANQLALVWMDHDVVDSGLVDVVSLQAAGARVPDLDRAVLGAGDHPAALAVERNARDIVGMALKVHHRIRVGRLDIVELDVGVARRREVSFVRRDAQSVDLRVRVL